MYWNWDTSIPYIFFKWWTAETPLGLGLAVIIVFSLAFLYENVINLRSRYDTYLMSQASEMNTLNDNQKTASNASDDCCSSLPVKDFTKSSASTSMRRQFTTTQSLIRSSLFAFSNFYSLFLMMIFMTYNAYLCIALVMGAGTGHFWSSIFIPEADILNRPRSCCN